MLLSTSPCGPSIAPLLPLVPGIGQAVVLGMDADSLASIRAGSYDTILLLTNSFKTAWLARRSGVPERWGYRNEFRSVLLTQGSDAADPGAPGGLLPAAHHVARLRAWSARAVARRARATCGCSAASAWWTLQWDRRTPLVAVAPGAAFGGAKRWPAAHVASTIDALARDGVRAVLIGAPADAKAGADVLALVRTSLRPIDLIGRTDLSALAAVLVHCRGLVTNDSGAMHVAAALGVDVTAVFGPTNEHETRPLGTGRLSVVHTNVWCRPCMLRECPLTHRCMTGRDAGCGAA